MSNPPGKGVCNKHKSNMKVVCDQCGLCRCYDANTVCQSNMNHFGYQIKPESEQSKIKFNRKTIYCGRYRLSLTDELDLCDDGKFYPTRRIYLKLAIYLVLKPKFAMGYLITVVIWRTLIRKQERLFQKIRSSKCFRKNYLPHLSREPNFSQT